MAKKNVGIHGCTIVANTLLTTKIAHRASVNGISKNMKNNISKTIKEFIWGGTKKRARVRWKILIKHQSEGGTGLKDPVMTLDTSKIKILQKLISRERQPWMRWIERKLIRIANQWNVDKAMAAKPTRSQRKQLKETCLTESTLKIWIEIKGEKRP